MQQIAEFRYHICLGWHHGILKIFYSTKEIQVFTTTINSVLGQVKLYFRLHNRVCIYLHLINPWSKTQSGMDLVCNRGAMAA
jgi:hypothetical protein